MYMEPQLTAEQVVAQYSRFATTPSSANASTFAELLWALERNWRGDAMTSPQPLSTLATAEQLQREAAGGVDDNWRIAAHLFRA